MTDGVTERQPEPVRPRVILLGSDELSRELAVALRHLGAIVVGYLPERFRFLDEQR